MAKKTKLPKTAMKSVRHAQWAIAHESGMTRNGRLLARGGRHKNSRREGNRKACRKGNW